MKPVKWIIITALTLILLHIIYSRRNNLIIDTGLEIHHSKTNTTQRILDDVIWRSPDQEEISRMLGPFIPLSEETYYQVKKIQIERKQRVATVCDKYNKSLNIEQIQRSRQILVDDKHKILFCYVPKVGCTSWKVRLVLGTNLTQDIDKLTTHPSVVDNNKGLAKFGINTLNHYSSREVQHILNNYYKLMFTRHPLERILSSYRSKWERREDNKVETRLFYGWYYKQVIKVLKLNNTKEPLSFEDFVKYLTIRSENPKLMEPHWERFNKLCYVCDIDYDFIGKFDTLRDDIAFVLRQIYRSTTEFYFPNVTKPRSALDRMKQYYGQLDHKLIKQLEEVYRIDFELFGYEQNTMGSK